MGASINRSENQTNVVLSTSYVYNQSGIRVRADSATSIAGGAVINKTKVFLLDSFNHTGYAQVLEEKDSDLEFQTGYTIGDDVVSQQSTLVSQHLLYDGHKQRLDMRAA